MAILPGRYGLKHLGGEKILSTRTDGIVDTELYYQRGRWGISWLQEPQVFANSGVELESSRWYHLAVVRHNGVLYLYTDGIPSSKTYELDRMILNGEFVIGGVRFC